MKLLEKLEDLVAKINGEFFYAVIGGVAVDGYAGKTTRVHPDIDLIIFREDIDKAEKVLNDLGYKHKRFTHPLDNSLEYKMQTGGKNHIFSFQIADRVGQNKFEISFYRDLRLRFPLSYIKPPTWLELEGAKFPAVRREFLIELKESELGFFEKLKKSNPKRYQKKRKQKRLNTLHDLKMLRK